MFFFEFPCWRAGGKKKKMLSIYDLGTNEAVNLTAEPVSVFASVSQGGRPVLDAKVG